MKYFILKFCTFFFALMSLQELALADNLAGIEGSWRLIPEESDHLVFYNDLSLKIKREGTAMQVVRRWEQRFPKIDSVYFPLNGTVKQMTVDSRVWPSGVFMGVSAIPGSQMKVSGLLSSDKKKLSVTETYPVLVSQGKVDLRTSCTYILSENGNQLTMLLERESRKGTPAKYVFRREGANYAYYMELKDKWNVEGDLSENAFLISLQGIVNTKSPELYFVYPENYDYRLTPGLFSYYKNHLGYSFTQIKTPGEALKIFHDQVKGYIVWDKSVRSSLNVAFTLAGLEKAVIIAPDQIPMVAELGLKEIADFRGKFAGMDDAAIFGWAYKEYWKRCNKDYVVWMGGVAGNQMMPGVADFGISKGCFFTDLSTDPKDTVEYKMASMIMSEMNPLAMVMGWHSYAKDLERNYVSLASSYGLRVEGLNTFPNLSFTSRTPPSPGFQFKNQHNIKAEKEYIPEQKTYITCVQTDGLGLGAWTKPGRGSMPYAWEVTINWQWMAPVLLEFYYSNATPNDYFFGALSGPGYMYPKAIPRKLLPSVIKKADELMHKLDLNVFETMDYSEGSTVVGNTELPAYLVDAYYKYMPDAIGFMNGYAPAYTFTCQNGRPFVSFDYYLDENEPEKDAVADLKELIALNKRRPYFLLLHVREFNNIDRVKRIVDKLGPDTEVVPLDIFLKMAGKQPTFQTRFLENKGR